MTDEQIKQNAESIVQELSVSDKVVMYSRGNMIAAAIAGAHSRDEEIKGYQAQINMTADALQRCMDELNQLRNPWISVEERLPEEGKDILLSHRDGIIVRLGCVRIGDINFIKNHIQCYMCWMETPKPELKKGE